jgi:hypothetical protein
MAMNVVSVESTSNATVIICSLEWIYKNIIVFQVKKYSLLQLTTMIVSGISVSTTTISRLRRFISCPVSTTL